MKLILIILFIFSGAITFSQQKEFLLNGKIVGPNKFPVPDAHVINFRNLKKVISDHNGKFNMRVQPGDSIMISHVVFFRKKIYADSIKTDPIIILSIDTINIAGIRITPNQKNEYELARENIQAIEFDLKPRLDDEFTDKDLIESVIKTENALARSASYSVNFIKFSPTQLIGKLLAKRERRKKSNEFKSTQKKK